MSTGAAGAPCCHPWGWVLSTVSSRSSRSSYSGRKHERPRDKAVPSPRSLFPQTVIPHSAVSMARQDVKHHPRQPPAQTDAFYKSQLAIISSSA